MHNLLGIVLCGGQSKRMGTDKGLILDNGKPWSLLMAEKLTAVKLSFVISINSSQQDSYSVYFDKDLLVTDHTNIQGPINGLVSSSEKSPDKDLLLLACDMTNMRTQTLEALIAIYINNPGFDFYAYHNGKFWEPLCAIYTSAGIKKSKNKPVYNNSFQHLLNAGNTFKIQIIDDKSFTNKNSI